MNNVLIRKIIPYFIVSLGIAYGIWPIDAIPDVPIIGWVDDIGVMGTTILAAFMFYFKNRKKKIKKDQKIS